MAMLMFCEAPPESLEPSQNIPRLFLNKGYSPHSQSRKGRLSPTLLKDHVRSAIYDLNNCRNVGHS